jgi:hypothetical protein
LNNYITGDTHADMKNLIHRIKNCPENTKRLFVAGDFGFIWASNDKDILKELRRLDYLNRYAILKNIEILFIDGNHENFNRLYEFPIIEKYGAPIGHIRSHISHLRRGEVYTIDNTTIFTLGGAISIDKRSRIENVSWWSQEAINYAEETHALKTLDKHNWKVDYVITHSAPKQAFHLLQKNLIGDYGELKLEAFNKESKLHSHIAERLQFKHWYFGHYHFNGSEGQYTCLYNFIKPMF